MADGNKLKEKLFNQKKNGWEGLTEKQRNVIVLYYFKGLTDIEIGKTLKKGTQNITFLRLRALKNLKKSLNEYIEK